MVDVWSLKVVCVQIQHEFLKIFFEGKTEIFLKDVAMQLRTDVILRGFSSGMGDR
jgi:hypothetical protein